MPVLVSFFSCEGAICRGNLIARWGRLLNLVRSDRMGGLLHFICKDGLAESDFYQDNDYLAGVGLRRRMMPVSESDICT